jgi:peptide/nickel transport system permease protein
MAVSELGNIDELEDWERARESSFFARVRAGVWSFARKKPLGAACGIVVLLAVILGDVVPEVINKVSRTPIAIPGFEVASVSVPRIGTIKPDTGEPMPYLADVMEKNLAFVHPYDEPYIRHRLEGSSSEFILGTDAAGRDIFSRLLYGMRVAVVVSFGAVFIASMISASIGIAVAYYGGLFDKLMFRLVDVFQALPGLLVLITVMGLFDRGIWPLTFVMGLLFGLGIGPRVIRSQALAVMVTPYVEAARVIGASDRRIMLKYVLPNVFPLIVLSATLLLGIAVLFEATVSFLGYGINPPYPSWGQMLSLDGRQYMRSAPGLAIYPGIAIGLLVFSFNLLGDALRDVLDPRLRGSR